MLSLNNLNKMKKRGHSAYLTMLNTVMRSFKHKIMQLLCIVACIVFIAYCPLTTNNQENLIISPLLKLVGGGMKNMETPKFMQANGFHLTKNGFALTKNGFDLTKTDPLQDVVIIDIGVYDGDEAVAAVKKGFTVYAIEPINKHIDIIHEAFAKNGLKERMKFINLTQIYEAENDAVDAVKEYLRQTKKEWIPQKDGFMYLFQAAASNEYGVTKMKGAGAWTSMNTNNVPRNQINGPVSTAITVPISDIVERDVMWFKSDTQGFEILSLKGAIDLFQNYKVDYVYIEFWPNAIIKNFGETGIADLMLVMQNDLKRTVCYPSRTDDVKFVSSKNLNIAEFDTAYKKFRGDFDYFDELICV